MLKWTWFINRIAKGNKAKKNGMQKKFSIWTKYSLMSADLSRLLSLVVSNALDLRLDCHVVHTTVSYKIPLYASRGCSYFTGQFFTAAKITQYKLCLKSFLPEFIFSGKNTYRSAPISTPGVRQTDNASILFQRIC
jgi:hypothetical protein